eukprot:UN25201
MGSLCAAENKGGGSTSTNADDIISPDLYKFVATENRVANLWEHFDEVKEMGQGASCRVLEARGKHSHNKDKHFALKEMKRDDEWNPKLFQTEYDILTTVRHQNIVVYQDSYIDRKNFYVGTMLCKGGELFDRIRKNKRFSERKAAEILNDIISAIGFCHENNIVHRDLKPENILYRYGENGEDILTIIDFGDAKQIKDECTYNEFVGTAFYLPPEIVRNRKGWELKRSDMWSIGVIAYVLMTGRPPFYAGNHKEILRKILNSSLKFPRKPELSPTAKNLSLVLWIEKHEEG